MESPAEIDPVLGAELSRETSTDGLGTLIEMVILPAADLRIVSPFNFSIQVPSTYKSRGGAHVFVDLTSIPSNFFSPDVGSEELKKPSFSFDQSSGELIFPALKGTTYSLEVWFHTVRNVVKRCGTGNEALLWQTPIVLRQQFPLPTTISTTPDGKKPGVRQSRASGITLRVGAGRNQGRRSYMEDVDFAFPAIKCGPHKVQ